MEWVFLTEPVQFFTMSGAYIFFRFIVYPEIIDGKEENRMIIAIIKNYRKINKH